MIQGPVIDVDSAMGSGRLCVARSDGFSGALLASAVPKMGSALFHEAIDRHYVAVKEAKIPF